MNAEHSPQLPILAILNDTQQLTSLSLAQILGESRRPAAVRLRDAVAWVAVAAHGFTNVRIGMALGNRDQSTIRASLYRANLRRIEDYDFKLLTDGLLTAATARTFS